jgi:probable rRNA maturation factor
MRVLLLGQAPRGKLRGLLEKAARLALGRLAKRPGELCVIFLRDSEIRKLNRRFLRKDRPTDVIAFRYEDGAPGCAAADLPFGDVYIGLDAAKRQAKALGHSLKKELVTLVAHGALHLLGHDDMAPAAKKRMFKAQDRLVDRILPDEEEA